VEVESVELNDVETVETVEGTEATRNDYEERRGTSKSGVESLGQSIFLANCGQNSWVPFIEGCQDPRVT
jgi:hypothetical protein